MSPSTGPTSLGQLLSESWAFCKTYWKPILIAAVILGTISTLLLAALGAKATYNASTMMTEMGVNKDRMQEIADRMQAGDESAAAEMEALLENTLGDFDNDEEAAKRFGLQMFKAVGPLVGVTFLIGAILSVAGMVYYTLLALQPSQNAQVAGKKVPSLFFPMLWLWIWIFLRSFAWVPLIGIVTAIILGPRFALAPVILIQEKKTAMQSASESYARTTGYWGKIFGNAIVAALCMFLASIVIGIIAGIGEMIIPFLGMWIREVGKFAVSAFMAAFMVRLALTIMANPIAKVTAKK
jgi:hypothetical protein